MKPEITETLYPENQPEYLYHFSCKPCHYRINCVSTWQVKSFI